MTRLPFGVSIALGEPLEMEFDRDLAPATVNGRSIWLRAGRREIGARLEQLSARVVRVTPLEQLPEGERLILTIGSGLQGTDGSGFEPAEFATLVRASEVVEILSVRPSVQGGAKGWAVRFSSPVSPSLAGTVRLSRPDGSEVKTRSLQSTDG